MAGVSLTGRQDTLEAEIEVVALEALVPRAIDWLSLR
jgi:hypothetical protein